MRRDCVPILAPLEWLCVSPIDLELARHGAPERTTRKSQRFVA